jgi:hypothetical protein
MNPFSVESLSTDLSIKIEFADHDVTANMALGCASLFTHMGNKLNLGFVSEGLTVYGAGELLCLAVSVDLDSHLACFS